MSKNRKILLLVFIAVSLIGMWARHSYHENEKRKREELFRRLALRPTTSASAEPAAPAEPRPVDPRPIFDSTLPQETFDLVRQKVGADFKLMEVSFNESLITFTLSTDATAVQQYRVDKNTKEVTGPAPVNVIGGGKLSDSLYDPKLVDFSLIPRLAKEGVERAGLPEGRADRVGFRYAGLRYEGEGPEWTVTVYSGSGADSQHKFVMFDPKGKFKKMF